MFDRNFVATGLVASVLLFGAAQARGQQHDEGDSEDRLTRRVGDLERKLDRVNRKLDRVLALLDKGGKEETPVREADVPNAIYGGFKKAYPAAKTLGWFRSGDELAVRIQDGARRLELRFADDGSFKEHPLATEAPVVAHVPERHAAFPKEKEIALPGEGSWDYVTVDPVGARAYVAHLTAIDVIDLKKNEKVGEVQGLDGAHGTAIVPEVGRGFSTSGKNNKVVVYDLKTLKVTNEIEAGVGPDAILTVTSQGEVWAMNHKGGTITCLDPRSLEVKKTIEVGGTLEFAREDAATGFVYVNVEDRDLLVAIDAKKHEVVARHSVAPGKEPAGLALDAKDGLLFIGCNNKQLVVMEAATGKIVAALESGEHCDGCAFDPETKNVFATGRDATYAFLVKDAKTVESLGGLDAGKTCSIDPLTHKVYVTAGKRGEKDSVKLLVFTSPAGALAPSAPSRGEGARRPSLVERIKAAAGLTDEQTAKVNALNEKMRADMDKVREESGADRAGRAQKMTALIAAMRDEIRKFLDKEQLPKFDEFVKKEDESFAASRGQSRGGRGGGENAPETPRPVNGHPDRTIVLPGTGGFDYLNADAGSRRLYVAHASKVDVIDMDKDEKIAEIEGVDGAHGTAIAAGAKHGFATSGRKKKLIAFDLDTNKVVKEIDTGEGPDAAIYASSVDEAWSINHRGGNVTCVDAKSLEVKATVDVGGTLEFAAEIADRVFVNVEDRNVIAAIDAKKHEVVARFATAPGENPAGLASDPKDGLLFAGCRNKKLVVLEGATGKVVASFDIGSGCDAVAFDGVTRTVYASCSDGTTTILPLKDGATFGAPRTLETVRGGKCCAVDAKTHKLYVASAPRRNEGGEAKVLVFGPEGPKSPD
jgi:DNA-binding beta-propeller fold protein YncE